MISKIIQKEKERQDESLKIRKSCFGKSTHGNCCSCTECKNYHDECKCDVILIWNTRINSHKQSLINLKEYMEDCLRIEIIQMIKYEDRINQLKEDIKELTKMIERYG